MHTIIFKWIAGILMEIQVDGPGERYKHKSCHIFLYKTHWHDLFYRALYSLMKIFLTVFKIEGIVALTI